MDVFKGKELAHLRDARGPTKVLNQWGNTMINSQLVCRAPQPGGVATEKLGTIEPPGSASGPTVLPNKVMPSGDSAHLAMEVKLPKLVQDSLVASCPPGEVQPAT